MNDIKEKPNRIAELRHKFGISQEQLAEKLNVTQVSASLYENGGNVPVDMLIEIADHFGVTLDYLLKRTNESPSGIWLSDGEQNILQLYRSLPPSRRKTADEIINIIRRTVTA